MTQRAPDALELLLPDAAPQLWQRAQRVTTFLRLLHSDARASADPSVGVNLARARGEWERAASLRRQRTHEELLRHHVGALLGPDSFLDVGETTGSVQQAWSALEEEREEAGWVAEVPGPCESVHWVIARLLEGLERSGATAARIEWWRACWTRAREGPADAERAFERCWSSAAGPARAAALAGMVESMLDRGAVGLARARLQADGGREANDPRLKRLSLWLRVLAGDFEGVKRSAAAAPISPARLPLPLAELRDALPAVAALLPVAASTAIDPRVAERHERSCRTGEPDAAPHVGAKASAQDPADPQVLAAADRSALGAALFSAWLLIAPGRARLAAHAVAPGLRGRWRAWLDEREEACADPREVEGRLLVEGDLAVQHFLPPDPSPGIDPTRVRAIAWSVLHDRRGDGIGWLRVEFEHHLVPSAVRWKAIARAWAERLEPAAPAGLTRVPARLEDEGSAQAEVLRGFVDGLSLKTAQRRWSAFDLRGGEPALVAQGGGAFAGLEDAAAGSIPGSGGARGEGRAVARAISSGRSVAFREPDRKLALHAAAMSGVAVPLVLRDRVVGVWLIESTRRRDFSADDVERFEARARSVAEPLSAAQFSSWHTRRFGHGACVRAPATCAGLSGDEWARVARASRLFAIRGPAGSGRRTLARRWHFEGPDPEAPVEVRHLDARGLDALAQDESFDERRGEGATWILEGADALDSAAQRAIAAQLDRAPFGRMRLCFLFDASAGGRALEIDLAARLARVELELRGLGERRDEIPDLARLFAAHFASSIGRRAPRFDDSAIGFLWRQAWPDNLRGLADAMYRVVLCAASRDVDASALEQIALRFGRPALRKLPPRGTDAATLRAALRVTAHPRGGWNKTRAAAYLGWDPDTLHARLQDAKLAAQDNAERDVAARADDVGREESGAAGAD